MGDKCGMLCLVGTSGASCGGLTGRWKHMREISQGVQSMEMMSYLLFFLATVFGNLEVWKVRK